MLPFFAAVAAPQPQLGDPTAGLGEWRRPAPTERWAPPARRQKGRRWALGSTRFRPPVPSRTRASGPTTPHGVRHRTPLSEVAIREQPSSRSHTHIAAVPRGLLARVIRTVNSGITCPHLEPIAIVAIPPTAETAPTATGTTLREHQLTYSPRTSLHRVKITNSVRNCSQNRFQGVSSTSEDGNRGALAHARAATAWTGLHMDEDHRCVALRHAHLLAAAFVSVAGACARTGQPLRDFLPFRPWRSASSPRGGRSRIRTTHVDERRSGVGRRRVAYEAAA